LANVDAHDVDIMSSIEVFEKHAQEYDEWFDENKAVYESEILALKALIPNERTGLEVGVGTGRFAAPLGIRIGVEPAKARTRLVLLSPLKTAMAMGLSWSSLLKKGLER
jgi:hypothetical protein